MPYKIDNAILKKDKTGRVTLIDPENVFKDEDAFVAINHYSTFNKQHITQ